MIHTYQHNVPCCVLTESGRRCKGKAMLRGLCHAHFRVWYEDRKLVLEEEHVA
jgi:hypothetical protein